MPEPVVPEAFIAFDCETTGLDPRQDALLQLAACAVRPQGRETWSTLVDPGRPVRLQIQRLTGISPERLEGAPRPDEALAAFRRFVGDIPLVAHNAGFDTAFVQAGISRAGLPPLTQEIYDTLDLARLVEPAGPSHKLADLIARRGLNLERAHDALADAVATADLFVALVAELRELDPRLVATISHLLGPAGGPLGKMVRAMAGGRAEAHTIRRELSAVADFGERRGDVGVDVASLLRPDSVLAERLAPFEIRPGQAEMLAAVGRALASDRHLVVEAGIAPASRIMGRSLATNCSCRLTVRVATTTR